MSQEIIITFETEEWDEIEKRIIGKNRRRHSSYFIKLLNLKFQNLGNNCYLTRK